MKSLLKKLVETHGPSGYESEVRELIRSEVEPLADEIRVDPLGNLIVRKGSIGEEHPAGKARGKRILLAAHMDEIGLIVTYVDDKGYARFTNIGVFRTHTLPGNRVQFIDGTNGVIWMERPTKPKQTISLDRLYIDVGASNRQDCPVQVGDVAAIQRPFIEMGDRLVSKAMDDRVGVAILIETLRQLDTTPHEIYFAFTVQEEVGVRGVTPAAYGIDPELGLAVDVTGTGDTPKGMRMDINLGDGPAITVRDGKMLSDPRVVDWMVRTADNGNIPYQLEVSQLGSTDARAIQITRTGVSAGCLSIPCRYVHTPSEMVDLEDVNNSVRLLLELLNKPIDL
jgi:endoglucanase